MAQLWYVRAGQAVALDAALEVALERKSGVDAQLGPTPKLEAALKVALVHSRRSAKCMRIYTAINYI